VCDARLRLANKKNLSCFAGSKTHAADQNFPAGSSTEVLSCQATCRTKTNSIEVAAYTQKYSTAGSLVMDPSRNAEKFVREVSDFRRVGGAGTTAKGGVSVKPEVWYQTTPYPAACT